MATITLEYNARNSLAAKTVDYVLSLGAFKIKHPTTTPTFDRSMKDLELGRVTRLKNIENPIEELLQ